MCNLDFHLRGLSMTFVQWSTCPSSPWFLPYGPETWLTLGVFDVYNLSMTDQSLTRLCFLDSL